MPATGSFERDSKDEKDAGTNAQVVLQAHTRDIYPDDTLDPVYHAKARILNDAIQEIGMGKYQVRLSLLHFLKKKDAYLHLSNLHLQWFLFVVAGFGRLS